MKDLEFIHSDLYGVALEASKKFLPKTDTRPILNYVLHRANGEMLATDSFKLIQVKNIHGFKEDVLINPKNHMQAKGKYPDLTTTLLSEKAIKSITLNKEQIKLWLQMFKSFNQIMKVMLANRLNIVQMIFHDDNLEIAVNEIKLSVQLPHEEYTKPQFDSIHFNPEHLRDALEAHFKLGSEEVHVSFENRLKPFILDDEKAVKTLVLPIRTSPNF